MVGHTCHHCKEWIPEGQPTIAGRPRRALTADLSDDLREARERVRETTDWLREAYELPDVLAKRAPKPPRRRK